MSNKGFTLIELLIVVAIIAILAAIALPFYGKYRYQARAISAVSDLRGFRDAFIFVSIENGEFPDDSHVVLPPPAPGDYDVARLIDESQWLATTPVGGNYNWEGPDGYPYAGVSILDPTAPAWVMEYLDSRLDDGDLSTGIFRITPNERYTFIFEE